MLSVHPIKIAQIFILQRRRISMDMFRQYRDWVRAHGNVLSIVETSKPPNSLFPFIFPEIDAHHVQAYSHPRVCNFSGLSSLTWLLPDRFSENELSLEAIHTAINLVSVLHDAIINDPGPGAPPGAGRLAFALAAIQQAEVVVELWARHNERTGALTSQYDPLIAVEGLKAIVRISILRASGARILPNGGASAFESSNRLRHVPSRMGVGIGAATRAKEVLAAFAAFREKHACGVQPNHVSKNDDAAPACSSINIDAPSSPQKIYSPEKVENLTSASTTQPVGGRRWWDEGHLPGGGKQQQGSASASVRYAASFNPGALREVEQRTLAAQSRAARLIIAGELVHVLRPLLYVAALRRWGRRSWTPWVVSLVVELASARLTAAGASYSRQAATAAAQDPTVVGTGLAALYGMQGVRWRREEADELTRRKLLLLFSLLRDPFFGRFTGVAVERWRGLLGTVPLVGGLVDKAAELLLGMQTYYTYTAAS